MEKKENKIKSTKANSTEAKKSSNKSNKTATAKGKDVQKTKNNTKQKLNASVNNPNIENKIEKTKNIEEGKNIEKSSKDDLTLQSQEEKIKKNTPKSNKRKKIAVATTATVLIATAIAVPTVVYLSRRKFDVNILTNTDIVEEYTVYVKKGVYIQDLTAQQIEGYTFVGFYKDAKLTQPYGKNDRVRGDMQIYAKYEINIYSLKFPTSPAFTIEGEAIEGNQVNIEYNTEYQFKINLNAGYSESEITVKANGEIIEADSNGYYTLTVKDDIVIEVEGVEINTYTITFYDETGETIYKIEEVEYNQDSTYKDIPTKHSTPTYKYTFAGWVNKEGNPVDLTNIIVDKDVYASFTEEYIEYRINKIPSQVVIKDSEGIELTGSNTLHYGDIVEITYDVTEGHNVIDFSVNGAERIEDTNTYKITGDLTVTYSEEIQRFTVIWQDYDGTILETDTEVAYGTMAEYNGAEPSRESTENEKYTFKGWSPEIGTVMADITYTAQYDVEYQNIEDFKISDGIIMEYTGTDTNIFLPSSYSVANETTLTEGSISYEDLNTIMQLGSGDGVDDIEYIANNQLLQAMFYGSFSITLNGGEKLSYSNIYKFMVDFPTDVEAQFPDIATGGAEYVDTLFPAQISDLTYSLSMGEIDTSDPESMANVEYFIYSFTMAMQVAEVSQKPFSVLYPDGAGVENQTSLETAMSALESLVNQKMAEAENKYNQYLEEHPDATEEEKQAYQMQLQLGVYSFTFSVSPFKTGIIVAGDDYIVTGIGSNAFANNTTIQSITIPESIISIAPNAFGGCTLLDRVIFKNTENWNYSNILSSKYIDGDAIDSAIIANPTAVVEYLMNTYSSYYLVNGEYAVMLPFVIEDGVITDYTGNGGVVTIPASYSIADDGTIIKGTDYKILGIAEPIDTSPGGTPSYVGPFMRNSSITKIIIEENGITSIPAITFQDCSNLTSITIPASVTSIESSAFDGCGKLANVYYEGTIDEWVEISFDGSNSNPLSNGANLYVNGDELVTEVSIDTATTINAYVFYGYSSLTKLTIGSQVTSIGVAAFSGCTGLTSITIPASVTSIRGSAFSRCSNLATVIFEEGSQLESMGSYAFEDCSSLSSITIPANVTSIERSAFDGCRGLVEINYNATNLADLSDDNYVFYNAGKDGAGIIVNIGANVTRIPAYLFYPYSNYSSYSPNIVTVNFAENSQCTEIGSCAFSVCSSLRSITIPASVTSIGSNAFDGCRGLVEINYNATNLADLSDDNYVFFNAGKDGAGVVVNIGANVTRIPACLFSPYSGSSSYSPNIVTVNFAENSQCTEIVSRAFQNCSSLSSITIPASVTSIERSAFYGCTGLTEINYNATNLADLSDNNYVFFNAGKDGAGITVNIGANVTRIPAYLFYPYSSNSSYSPNIVTVNFAENSQCTEIGSCAFFRCSNLVTVIFEEGSQLESIERSAFNGCSSLRSITIPASVTSIGSSAFNGCSSLRSITIPASVTSIGSSAFNGCRGLVEINYNATNLADLSDDNYVFYNAGKDGAGIIVNIGANVTRIPAYLFYPYSTNSSYSPNIVTVNFAENSQCTEIGAHAFEDCSNLATVIFEEGSQLESIGSHAFYYCSSLTSITIPASVNSIGQDAFDRCSNLANVYYEGTIDEWVEISFRYEDSNPLSNGANLYVNGNELVTEVSIDSATTIKDYVFNGCGSLTKLTIGSQVTSIGSRAFYYCSSLTSITIPASVISIGNSAFYRCSNLATVIFENPNGWWVQYNSNIIELNSADIENSETLVTYLTSTYNNNTWYRADTKMPFIITSDGMLLKYVGSDTDVVIPSTYSISEDGEVMAGDDYSITGIGAYAFSGCSSLSSITIPASMTSIESNAFYNCSNLANVYYEGTIDEWMEISFGGSAGGPLSNGANLYVNGNQLVTELSIDSATTIKDYVFSGYESLTKVTIGSQVTSIGERAFYGCSNLATVIIEEGSQLESIGFQAFYDCSSLSSITIPTSMTSIESNAFYNCSNLANVYYEGTIDEWVEISFYSFDANPLYNGANLYVNGNQLVTEVSIDTATTINAYVFYGYSSLTKLTIGSQVTSIGWDAFRRCSNLATVIFEEGSQLESIGFSAFEDCSSLSSITIPASVTNIENSVFYNCSNLATVIIESNYAYKNAGTGFNQCGYLLENATVVRVLTSCIGTDTNSYLENTSNFTKTIDGEYTVYTKVS